MEIFVLGTSDVAEVKFDYGGNIYFNLKNNPDDIYDLTILNNNTIKCDKYMNGFTQYDISKLSKMGKLKLSDKQNSLMGKARREYVKNINNDTNDSDSDEDDNNNIKELQIIQKYYYEDVEYFQDYDDNSDDEEHVVFLKSGSHDIEIVEREDSIVLLQTRTKARPRSVYL